MPHLHMETEGQGQPLVLLHGWGLHGGVWAAAAAALAPRFQVWRVDLPGFGASAPLAGDYRAESLAQAVASQVPRDAIWVGWSLGGLVALAAALQGVAMKKLVLVGATPRFVQASDWPDAIAPEVLASFAEQLAADYQTTVLRFLALQARGSEKAREELRALRESVFARGEPSLAALRGGLDVLRDTDLRARLGEVTIPTLVIQGERDVLVPQAAAERLHRALPKGELAVIAGAGHAPFLSHPDSFNQRLVSFLHE